MDMECYETFFKDVAYHFTDRINIWLHNKYYKYKSNLVRLFVLLSSLTIEPIIMQIFIDVFRGIKVE